MNEPRHGEQFSPDAVAGSLSRGDGGFGREQSTYFDHPILRKSHWRWEIEWYFFLGGLSAMSGLVSIAAARGGNADDAALVRSARYTALVGSAASGILLILDLGRPERFLNMMRIAKLKSPMSVGVYSLLTFSTGAGLAAAAQAKRDGIVPFDPAGWLPRPLVDGLLAAGSLMMSFYTGVLVSATAIPAWSRGRFHVPAAFACSAASTACAFQSLVLAVTGGSPRTIQKLERLELVAALAEAALLAHLQQTGGPVMDALFKGETGRRLDARTRIGGILIPTLVNLPSTLARRPATHRHPLRTAIAAGLVLAGGFTLRACILAAGRTSADDPRAYTQHPT